MRYSDYDDRIINENDILKYKRLFEKDIDDKQKELSEFLDRANAKVEWINKCEQEKKYSVLGTAYKDGKNKNILLIIRYEDGTQRNERYSFRKISEMREKLEELKDKHSDVDWSLFENKI